MLGMAQISAICLFLSIESTTKRSAKSFCIEDHPNVLGSSTLLNKKYFKTDIIDFLFAPFIAILSIFWPMINHRAVSIRNVRTGLSCPESDWNLVTAKCAEFVSVLAAAAYSKVEAIVAKWIERQVGKIHQTLSSTVSQRANDVCPRMSSSARFL